jgi:hypothetical protein
MYVVGYLMVKVIMRIGRLVEGEIYVANVASMILMMKPRHLLLCVGDSCASRTSLEIPPGWYHYMYLS